MVVSGPVGPGGGEEEEDGKRVDEYCGAEGAGFIEGDGTVAGGVGTSRDEVEVEWGDYGGTAEVLEEPESNCTVEVLDCLLRRSTCRGLDLLAQPWMADSSAAALNKDPCIDCADHNSGIEQQPL